MQEQDICVTLPPTSWNWVIVKAALQAYKYIFQILFANNEKPASNCIKVIKGKESLTSHMWITQRQVTVLESGDSLSVTEMPLISWHCSLTGSSSPASFFWDVKDSSPPASMRKRKSASHNWNLRAQSHWFWQAWLIHIHLGPMLIGLWLSKTT